MSERRSSGGRSGAGPVAEPQQAAALILVRDAVDGPEPLLVRRSPSARFMGGVWVFPGGSVQEDDRDHAAAAVRELGEEAGLRLAPGAEPVAFSRWITPEALGRRFDTIFFVAPAPPGAEPRPDGVECVDARWLRPGAALELHDRGLLPLVFPTLRQLEGLLAFRSVAELLSSARGRRPEPVRPRVVTRGGRPRVVLPGEPGYDD